MEQKRDSLVFHIELSAGGMFGDTAAAWNLSEEDLEREFLQKRASGGEVWTQGKGFRWGEAQFRVFQGPSTDQLEDFTPLLNPSAYFLANSFNEVTDRFVKGPPGGVLELEQPSGDAVFLVHGTNAGRREEIARFLEQVLAGKEVVVLHEQPNRGRTLIEKFEGTAALAGYAVVLLTGDDTAQPVGSSDTTLRARQNVVFELGFFFGKLGRGHVAVLYEEGVELPSDVSGLAYLPLDEADGWKVKLARELRDAGLDPDLNRLTQ